MNKIEIIKNYVDVLNKQEWYKIKNYFNKLATVEWPNTNELFEGIDNYVSANSNYPGNWIFDIERIEEIAEEVFTICKVSSKDKKSSLYAISFFEFENEKITKLTEFWSDNGNPPEWRIKLKLTKPLKKE